MTDIEPQRRLTHQHRTERDHEAATKISAPGTVASPICAAAPIIIAIDVADRRPRAEPLRGRKAADGDDRRQVIETDDGMAEARHEPPPPNVAGIFAVHDVMRERRVGRESSATRTAKPD